MLSRLAHEVALTANGFSCSSRLSVALLPHSLPTARLLLRSDPIRRPPIGRIDRSQTKSRWSDYADRCGCGEWATGGNARPQSRVECNARLLLRRRRQLLRQPLGCPQKQGWVATSVTQPAAEFFWPLQQFGSIPRSSDALAAVSSLGTHRPSLAFARVSHDFAPKWIKQKGRGKRKSVRLTFF